LGAAAHDGAHSSAEKTVANAFANRFHDAGKFKTRNIGRPTSRCAVVAAPLQKVGGVQTGGMDADQDFAGAGDWRGALLNAELSLVQGDGVHGATLKVACRGLPTKLAP